MKNEERFSAALYGVGDRLKSFLNALPETVKNSTEEIRLRLGKPLALTVAGDTVFVRENGQVCFYVAKDLPLATAEDLEESFKLLSGNSVYAHGEELKNGYIMMKNGCRAGVCGTLSEKGFLRDITSVNIRIAREIFGAANEIIKSYEGGGLLIAGPPGCGKTTVLRDFIRQVSNGVLGRPLRISLIDSRGEISGSSAGIATNDIGANTDVLVTPDKAAGIEIALRTMFPHIIAFDEIGTIEELRRVKESFFSGVNLVTTAHIESEDELYSRNVTRELLESGAISKIALLPTLHGGKILIKDLR